MSVKSIINKIKKGNLVKHWDRDYCVFFNSATALSYKIINSDKYAEGALTLMLLVHKEGICSYIRLKKDNDLFLKLIGEKLKKDTNLVNEIILKYSFYGDKILKQFGISL